jgi:hypothetical protein
MSGIFKRPAVLWKDDKGFLIIMAYAVDELLVLIGRVN